MNKRGRENCSRSADSAPDMRAALQRDAAAAYAHRQVPPPSPALRMPRARAPSPSLAWPGPTSFVGHLCGSHGVTWGEADPFT